MIKTSVFFLSLFFTIGLFAQRILYQTNNAQVKFVSDAPLELIKAESAYLRGVLDLSKNSFAFRLHVNTFEGFNSPLQKEHFKENYMEIQEFPDITFVGKNSRGS